MRQNAGHVDLLLRVETSGAIMPQPVVNYNALKCYSIQLGYQALGVSRIIKILLTECRSQSLPFNVDTIRRRQQIWDKAQGQTKPV